MGAGFRFLNIRLDQVAHLGLSLATILALAFGIVTLLSSRTQAGKGALLIALVLLITSHLINSVFSIVALNPDVMRWLKLLGLSSHITAVGGVAFLIIGLRALLERTSLLETLQEDLLEDQD